MSDKCPRGGEEEKRDKKCEDEEVLKNSKKKQRQDALKKKERATVVNIIGGRDMGKANAIKALRNRGTGQRMNDFPCLLGTKQRLFVFIATVAG